MNKEEVLLNNNVFDSEVKNLFLNDKEFFTSYASKKAYKSMLLQISKYEEEIDTKIYDMGSIEARRCIDTLTRTTLNASASLVSKLVKYIFWANANNCTKDESRASELISWLKSLTAYDIVSKTAMESQYYTKEDLYDIGMMCKNAQDNALLLLLFNSVEGIEMSELRLLKKSDVDFENNLVHVNGYSSRNTKEVLQQRDIKLEDYEMQVLKDAINQSTYYVRNVDNNKKETKDTIPLFDTEYVFRDTQKAKGKDIYEPISRDKLNTRIREIGRMLNKPLNAKNIVVSGEIYELNKLKKEFKDITDEEYENVLRKFNKNLTLCAISGLKDLYRYLVTNNIKVANQI